MPIKRDLTSEQRAVGVFQSKNGKLPDLNNPQERATVYKLAYPTELPDELKGTVDESLYSAGIAKPKPDTSLSGLRETMQGAQGEYEKFSQPNEAMRILQESIRAVSGQKEAPLGESKIFEQAGVNGMGALSASLGARSSEMAMNHTNFQNIIGKMAGNYADMANSALKKYQIAREDYNNEKTRLEGIEKEARQQEYAIQLIELRDQLEREQANTIPLADRIKLGLPTPELIRFEDIVDATPQYVPANLSTQLDAAAEKYGLPKSLLASLIQRESTWNPNAENLNAKEQSYGLGQINIKAHPEITPEMAKDPEFALDWAARRLSAMIDKYGLYEGVQAYNTPGAIGSKQLTSYANDILGRVKTIKKGGNVERLSPLARQFYEGKFTPKTPSQFDALSKEVADAGLDIASNVDALAVTKGILESYELLTKIPADKRGQIQGRWQEITKGAERDQDIQKFESTKNIVGMFLAKMVEKDRLSDKDRDFYLAQMPNLRQDNDKIAKESAYSVIKQMAQKLGLDSEKLLSQAMETSSFDISSYNGGNVIIKDPKTGEERIFKDLSTEEIQDAINKGYIIK